MSIPQLLVNQLVRHNSLSISQYSSLSFLKKGSETEYRTRYMSPRREDYIPHIVLPKIGSAQVLPRSRSFLSYDVDPNSVSTSSEYRLRYPNHHPKRPHVFHAQPSRIFDYVPIPTDSKISPRFETSPTFLKPTEYQERYPNYGSYMPIKDLIPPHLSYQTNIPSATQLKKQQMTRSQYFHELRFENEKLNGGQQSMGTSESRNAFQWPYHQIEKKSYSTMNNYDTIPPITIHREVYNTSN